MTTRMLRLLPCLAALIFILLPVAPLLASPPAVPVQPPVAKMRPASFTGTGRNALLVPSQYPNIQAAVDASQDGDTVLVADGTYSGTGDRDIDFHGKNIIVTSQNGPMKTIIDCGGYASTDGSGNHRGFYIHSGEKNAAISGFTVKNGYETYISSIPNSGNGGGVFISVGYSGTIVLTNTYTITLTNCNLTGNIARYGGGIYDENSRGGTITLTNCTVTGNTAQDDGGGIGNNIYGNNGTGGTTVMADCLVTGNTAYDGAGVANETDNYGGMITMTRCTVTGNTAQDDGGGVLNDNNFGGTITLTDCTAIGNTANNGGGIANQNVTSGSMITLTRCTVSGNTTLSDGSGEGGGIDNFNVKGGTIALTNCAVSDNTAQDGGGINNTDYSGGTITLADCAITGNKASYGGGVENYNRIGGVTSLANCTISANTAQYDSGGEGGGVFNYNEVGGVTTLTNCTISANTVYSEGGVYNDGGGVYADTSGGGIITLTDCIVYGDTGLEIVGCVVAYSDVQGNYPGTGNIDADPLFVNAATNDLHLQSGSPCLGKGTPSGAPATDKDGRARTSPPSIGAYELAATLQFPAQYPTIQSAVTAALSGDTVMVASGTYTGPGNVDWDFGGKDITVKSADGAASTIIDCGGTPSTDGSGNHRGFYIHSGETNAVIDGITVENGYEVYVPGVADSGYGGSICVDGSSASIKNCVFTGSTATIAGGGVAAIGKGHHSITFTNCVFTKNTAPSGGGVYNSNDSGTIALTNCSATGNTAQQGGGVFNQNSQNNGTIALVGCLASGNTAQDGGGIYNENDTDGDTITLINCSVSGNASPLGGGVYDFNSNSDDTILLINDIIYGDPGSEVSDNPLTASATSITFSDIQGGHPGTGNINADPLFVNLASGDLHLKPGSPCLGKGTPDGAPTTDRDGNTRPNPPSMGAYDLGAGEATRAVLLVHGTFSSASTWDGNGGMSQTLKSHGFIVEAADFPTEPETRSNEARIEDQASALKRRISELITRSGQPSVDLVCHSMGGLAARYYLEHQELWQTDGQGKPFSGVSKLVMLGTPNLGTDAPLLDPVATVSLAHFSTRPLGAAVDGYNHWSPAITEQFGEWEAAPDNQGAGRYAYPNGYKLYPWPLDSGSFSSPIQSVSYLFDGLTLDFTTAFSLPLDYIQVAAVVVKFPVSRRQRNFAHLTYYPQAAQKLGVDYPSNQGVHGVNKRLVSQFLYDLNQHPIVPGVEFYLIAGNSRIATRLPVYDVPGPFSQAMENDGVVPTQSAFGLDPLTGQPLFNTIHSYTVNTYHLGLPNNSEVIGHVLDWLSQ